MDGDSAISPTRGHRDLPPDVEEAGAGAHPLTAAVLAAVSDTDLGEACAISDVASRLGGPS